MSLLVVVLGTAEASGNTLAQIYVYVKVTSGLTVTLMQVYVNVKVMNDTHLRRHAALCGSGLARECDQSGNDGDPADVFAGMPAPTGGGAGSQAMV
ncbi:hypothetical protein AC138_23955 [Pseudomonas putida]|nr:hypothetical protein AC138_23955 [Pseudomonas putida]KMY30755.1 hypothetical protein AA993_20700 [Pseudomonas putida]PXZ46201.1 hypothetical protein DM483_25260 [Pseudomonas sp. SMT-1]